MEIEILINELEEELKKGRKTLIGNNVVVNADVLTDLVARLRLNLPDAIKEASAIFEDVEGIRREAQQKANEIINNARINAENMIKNSEIIRQATEEAERIKSLAAQQKDKADYNARRRVDELLEATENSITEALMIIRNERESIWDGMKKN